MEQTAKHLSHFYSVVPRTMPIIYAIQNYNKFLLLLNVHFTTWVLTVFNTVCCIDVTMAFPSYLESFGSLLFASVLVGAYFYNWHVHLICWRNLSVLDLCSVYLIAL